MRKIIQIATTSHAGSDQNCPCYETIALCDDGTLWGHTYSSGWKLYPEIPQVKHPEYGAEYR